MYALLLEQVRDDYGNPNGTHRAVILDVEMVETPKWDRTGRTWEYHKRPVASVASIFEYDGTVAEAAQVAIETFGDPITHVYMGDGKYIAPDALSVAEAAEAVMLDRDRILTEEGFGEDFFVTG